MKRTMTAAVLAISVLAGSAAMANSRHDQDRRHDQRDRYESAGDREHGDRRSDRDDRRRGQYERHVDDRRWSDYHDGRDDHRGWDRGRDGRYQHNPLYRYHAGEYRRPWGYSERSWRRGDRLPVAYYGRPYRVYNYERCGLRGPPRGYHWVRVNHDAVLAAIATGVVLDVVYNTFI